MSDLLSFCQKFPNIWSYLPEKKELCKVPKSWLVNVMFVVIGEPLALFIKNTVNDRNAKQTEKRKMQVEMDQAVYDAFVASTAVSCKSFSHDFG